MSLRVNDWVAHHARNRGDQVALVDLGSGRRFTWAQVGERAARLAAVLADEFGVGRGDRVAVLAHNTTNCLEVQFACAAIGAIMVPANCRLTLRELDYIWSDCKPSVIVHGSELDDVAAELSIRHGSSPRLRWGGSDQGPVLSYEGALAAASPLPAPTQVDHDDTLLIMYTSGTTGNPKGAMITHGMVFWNVANQLEFFGLRPGMVNLVFLPLFHIAGLNLFANPAVYFGGCNVVMPAFDPAEALSVLRSHESGITHTVGVPANFLMMSGELDFADATFPTLECVSVGGSPTPTTIIDTWLDKGVALQQVYGMTETSPTVMALARADAATRIGSAGQEAVHNEVRIVGDDAKDVAPGETGELWVRGLNVTPGYWNNPEATSEAITDGWLHTGDAARCDEDGFYYIVDRWKDMYISGGENVYPSEVENVLYEIDAIAEVAVVGVPDERWVEVGRAFVMLKPGHQLSEQAVVDHCRANLARYKVPKSVVFIDELPRNATGKILKRVLRDQAR